MKKMLAAALAAALMAAPMATTGFAQSAPAEKKTAAAPAKKLTSQQQKMKDCGAKWQTYKKEKNVKGRAEYQKFQKTCLKG